MADVGTTQANLPAGSSPTPNADQMNVDGGLDALAAFIVAAEAARVAHDFATVNSNLQNFWSAETSVDPTYLASQSTATGNLVQSDLLGLDAYSHRILGFEYLYQISQADKSAIQGLNSQAQAQFSTSVNEFTNAGLTMQASDDQNVLNQVGGWAAQTAAAWIDDSFTASVVATVNSDLAAAGNLISAAGSALSFLSNPAVLIGGAVALVALFMMTRK